MRKAGAPGVGFMFLTFGWWTLAAAYATGDAKRCCKCNKVLCHDFMVPTPEALGPLNLPMSRSAGLRPGSRPRGATTAPGRRLALVRLRVLAGRAVKVRSCAVKNRAVSNRNCVGAIRGGEQRNEHDQSVTQIARVGSHRELDSVGVAGRAFERKAKPVGAGVNPRATGQSPVGAPMVGDGMAGSSLAVIRETRGDKRGSWHCVARRAARRKWRAALPPGINPKPLRSSP
jgi:hypothetical protein